MTVISRDGDDVKVDPRTDLLRIEPTTMEIGEALNLLHGNLAVATELAEGLGDNGRAGLFRAMIAVIEFCASQGIPRAALYPLQLVAGAVVDAGRGVATPAFLPDRSGGRPPISHTEIEARAYSAVILECCIRHARKQGMQAPKREGSHLAVKVLKKSSWHLGLSAAQLIKLREEITSRDKNDAMRRHYEDMLETPVVDLMPLEYATLLATHGWVNSPPAGQKS